MKRIKEASLAYLKTVRGKNYSDDLLNQPAPDKYWKKYHQFLKKRTETVRKIEQMIKNREEEKKEQPKLIQWDDFIRSNSSSIQDVPYSKQSVENREPINV